MMRATNAPSATINAAVAELKDAYAELYKTMVRPEQNKWYIVKSADPEKQDMTFSAEVLTPMSITVTTATFLSTKATISAPPNRV